MDQPLWQNWLNIAFIFFVARRAGVAVALQWDSLNALVRGTYVVVLVACVLAGVAVWLSTRMVIAALCFLAATFSVASLVEMGQVDASLRVWIGVQLGIGLLATVGLVALARSNAAESKNHA